MNDRKHLGLIVFMVLSLPLLGWSQIEQRLDYYYGQEAIERIGGFIMFFHDPVDPPDGLKRPDFKAEDPLFFAWMTPETEEGCVWFAMDRSSPDQPHDLLIVDSDADRDLSDEQVLVCDPKEKETNHCILFRSVPLHFPDKDGTSVTYHVNVVYETGGLCLAIGSDCCYSGTMTIEGRDYEVIYKDNNHNGSFDRLSIAPQEQPDFRSLGRYFDLNETLYSLDILENGALIKLTSAPDVAMGQVQVPEGISYVRFQSELGTFCRIPKNGSVTLPQGTHHLSRWKIERKDAQGRQWRAEGRGFDEQGRVQVAGTDMPSLKIGEPLLSSLNVDRTSEGYRFSQGLTGHLSETITLYVDNEQADAPKLNVRDKTGKLVDTREFEYG